MTCASVDNWNDTCGPAPNDDLPVCVGGYNHPTVAGDEKKRCLVLCAFCLNACHPACAGLCPTVRRVKGDWACPECVCVAEEHLNLTPKHLSPTQALKAASAALHSTTTDAVESEEATTTAEPTTSKTGLAWLRWRLSQEKDFKEEQNMLQTLMRSRGHLCEFLPKFHCDVNWAENHWGKSKPCVRQLVDGGWMKMCQATWLSFGYKNIS